MFSGFWNIGKWRFDTTLTPIEFELNMATRNTLLRQGAFFCCYTYIATRKTCRKLIYKVLHKQVRAGMRAMLPNLPFLFPAQKKETLYHRSDTVSPKITDFSVVCQLSVPLSANLRISSESLSCCFTASHVQANQLSLRYS